MVRRSAVSLARGLAGWALPPRCPACAAVTLADHRFCAECWPQLRFLGPPWCAGCAAPFAFDPGGTAYCTACAASPPQHRGVRAAVEYGAVARATVLKLKYGGRIAHAATVARLMQRLVPCDAQIAVPVPLHRGRLWSRGYNQSGLIAAEIARLSGLPHLPDALARTRATPPLEGLGAARRRRVLDGAFAVAPRHATTIAGRQILLIDDVHTSGATAEGCTRALLAAGAAGVTILCWARVAAPSGD
ncbi:ComF family protein [Sphingomonas baiyangensis]|uniref:ComF family protein n=1 Tax=Sphingomonas baiyangensis TaxID=2572576 RepID=A0A4U1L5B1_9SPHN|nr:ComF family protein [Sphingomonas baiyangensis]